MFQKILLGILQMDETRAIVREQVERILHDEAVKSAVNDLIDDITHTPEVVRIIS